MLTYAGFAKSLKDAQFNQREITEKLELLIEAVTTGMLTYADVC
jgi:hypothetical protein